MGGFGLLLGFFALIFMVSPIFAIIAAIRVSNQHQRLTVVEHQLGALKAAVAAQAVPAQADPVPEPVRPVAANPAPEPARSVPVSASPSQATTPPSEALAPPSEPRAPTPAPPPQKAAPKSARPGINWEHRIAANWMVWAGGLALGLGGLFLVRVAIEAGFFGPTMRTILAAVLGMGLVAGSFRVKRLKAVTTAETAVKFLPAVLAGTGVITLFGATLAAGVLYGLLPPIVIFVLFALIAMLSVVLAWLYGPALAALGLLGAYIGPFFTGADGGSALTLLPYAFAVTAAALAIIWLKGWPFVSWLAFGGAMLWGVLGFADTLNHTSWAVPLYAIVLAAIAAVFGQHHARAPLDWAETKTFLPLRSPGEPLFVAHLFWVGAAALLIMHGVQHEFSSIAAPALSAFAGMGLLAAWRRKGYALLVIIGAATSLACLTLWSDWTGAQPVFAAVMAVLFSIGGWILLPRLRVQTPVALVSALFAPAAFLIAAWRMEGFDPGPWWAFAALMLATIYCLIMEYLKRRDPEFADHPGTAALYALATSIFLAVGAVFALSNLWLGTGAAFVALSLALLYRRFELPLLRGASVITGAASVILLLRPDLLTTLSISPVPVLNELSLSFLPAMAALFGAGWLLRAETQSALALRGMSAFLGFALVGLLIRHAAGGGSLTGPSGGLSEAAGYAVTYLGGAAGLFWRDSKGLILQLMRWAGLAVGCGALLMGFSALSWDAAVGWPVLNLLAPTFAMPAILLAVIALGMRRSDFRPWSKPLSVAAMGLGLVWALLETQRGFVGPALYAGGPPGDVQMWAYSAVLVIYAIALLMLGTLRKAEMPRFASLAILAVAIIKVFLFDMSTLDGALRAASFIGLGAALLGTALFYQRFVFGPRKPTPPLLEYRG